MLNKFTIILPVIDEEKSLKKTIKIILSQNKKNIDRIKFVLNRKKTTLSAVKLCENITNNNKKIFEIIYQKKPNLGGAMIDAFNSKIKSSHTVMMSSDLETDPLLLKKMIKQSMLFPNSIITASRWTDKSIIHDYGILKKNLNFIFQKFFSILYRTNCNDLTYGYRIFPTKLIKKISWKMHNHSFLFETLIKPLKLNINVIQITSGWKKRIEGKSHNNIFNYFWYFYVGIKVMFMKRKDILK